MMENGDYLSNMNELDDETLQVLYTWIDEIPLSRPKRNIARDFSDGVLVAEMVHHFIPKIVEIHNYSPANSVTQKKENWNTLQRKVLSRLDCKVSEGLVDSICKSQSGAIEMFLINLRDKIDKYDGRRKAAALRKQHQVYDELSTGIVSDTYSYVSIEGEREFTQESGYNSFYHPGMANVSSYKMGPYDQSQEELSHNSLKANPRLEPYVEQKFSITKQTPHTGHKQVHVKSSNKGAELPQNIRLLLEEKEQTLLSSQETVQILQVKVRRLEHLLHLKDIRIEDLTRRLQQATQPPPKHLPPQQNHPAPPISGAAGQPLPRMHFTPPLPPVKSPPKYGS
ncbi:sperm flagellar protein 1-like [Xenia sp. Carnegie-2017]|uniref:sperm flagellar protein 1-like n=1 Tax=Xenia sp. Carnegie-2017 TaxID=2897299 RepID=UPI001F048B9F|nr:sperm flagellar protein 1-like [Xenia sp. Carnegie-2017]